MDQPNLLEYLEANRERLSPLLVLTHDFPDPDALASAYALQYLAEKVVGIRSRIAYGGFVGRSENREMVRLLKIPAYKLRPSDFRSSAAVALVDTQPGFDNHSFPRNRKAAIVIDQHQGAEAPSADLVLLDNDAGATSTLLAQILLDAGVQIPVRLATALVYGILSDTLDFYRVAHREVVETYLRLLPMGDVHILARIQNPVRPRRYFNDLHHALTNAQVRQSLIVSHLGRVENPDLVSQMADVLLTCERVEWALCTGRHGENLHLSLRTTRADVTAGAILRTVVDAPRQAGGHGRIAGGRMHVGKSQDEERWSLLEQTVTQRLVDRLKLRKRGTFVPLVRTSIPPVPEG